ncbi:MAG TPA: DNA-directed RNA polymerase subunit K [Nitrososphaeraceae archaeon]
MVEELDNKYIDNTLNDIKSQNETEETKIKKPSKNTKKALPSKAETKTRKSRPKSKKTKTTTTKEIESEEEAKSEEKESQKFESLRKEKFVEYDEADYTLREISIQDQQILIGPKRITRFEKARITGARALQISFGAPLMIKVDIKSRSSISIAIEELETKSLPISIRRILPNGLYQDVPLEWLKT